MNWRILLSALLIGLILTLAAIITTLGAPSLDSLRTFGQPKLTSPQQDKALVPPEPTVLPTPTPSSVSLIFVGDMMFDRHIRVNAQKNGYDSLLDEALRSMFTRADAVIGNLEGPVSEYPSRSVGSAVGSTNNYFFTFDPAVVSFLDKANINIVSLGNNHILNFGQDGLLQTHANLDAGNVQYFGHTGAQNQKNRWRLIDVNGMNIAFVNYNQFLPEAYDAVLADLAEAANSTADMTILYTHWGNEYVPENAALKLQAREFVAAGADLIIGSHPHVVTGQEDIEGVRVYYSLGNFIFDQYFEPAVQRGLVVMVDINRETQEMTFEEFEVQMNKGGQTSLIQND